MQQTSLDAYASIANNLPECRSRVLKVIKLKKQVCNKEISEILGISINRVTGRTNELVKQGYVIELTKKPYDAALKVIHWGLTEKGINLFKNRK